MFKVLKQHVKWDLYLMKNPKIICIKQNIKILAV